MLDRSKLMKEFSHVGDQLFLDYSDEIDQALSVWRLISHDATFLYKIKSLTSCKWVVPAWQGLLGDVFPVLPCGQTYSVISVDGSQIYPDKHQGSSAFLINVGTVELHYGKQVQARPVYLNSQPYVFIPEYDERSAVELVNCRRQEFELQEGVARSLLLLEAQRQTASAVASLLLFDGSLIFWHLASKEEELKDLFFQSYIHSMQQLSMNRMLFAGYISLPKSKELVNLVRVALFQLGYAGEHPADECDHCVDTTIAYSYLSPFTRSIVFRNNASITEQYPPDLRPYFFYIHGGVEIGRVEIPAWIAHDQVLVDRVASIVLDQACKGNGYPVVIAEAHEQAVVKGADRDFFYQLIIKTSIEHKRQIMTSAKSQKKRSIGI